MTGPLAPLFAQVREGSALLADWAEEPLGMESVDVDNVRGRLLEALSAIERHVQDMETALEEIPGKPPYRIAGIPSGIISADDWDVTDEVLAFLAALPAREKGTE